jgi:diguanylate cyclase (GGDEF)-like protein
MSKTKDDSQHQTQVFSPTELGAESDAGQTARVVVIQGPELGRQFTVGREPLVLGRASDCELHLSASGISRRHCRFDYDDGQYWIEDLGSTNHTRINEAVIERRALADGDRIRLGQTVLKFIGPNNPEAAWLEKMADEVTRDRETGLFNRHYFQANLEAAVESASANPEESGGGIVYLALDASAPIRDRIGISGLDRLVGHIGKRIVEALDKKHLTARFAECSLVVMATGLEADELTQLADDLRRRVSSSVFDVNGQEVAASVSVGICPFSLRISDADMLIVCAARAAEKAQASGGNRIETYQPDVSAAGASDDERSMLGLLREALKKNTLQTLFQPAVSTGEEGLTHYQLLPRLLTDDNQLITAAEFIPVAASHGEIRSLDRWMSVRALAVIREQLGKGNQLRLFISQSADSLTDDKRFDSLGKNLETEIAEHRLLIIEFRQADLNQNLKAARQLLPKLRRMGFGISVSGVGDEAQPELLLNHFDIDYVKLTPRFAEGIGSDPKVSRQFDHIAETFHGAGARVIIGHVEDAETMGRMWSSRADLLQGNFIQRPTQTPDFTLHEDE